MNRENHTQIFFHIDVNSAFLSWSALKALSEGASVDLRTIPSIVGGDQEKRRGIVLAKSIPAKPYGIVTAEPVASAMKKCPNLTVVSPDHAYYRQMSHSLMEYLSSVCPKLEQVSIDECYMAFDPVRDQYDSPKECATMIRDAVYDRFGFTVNVGISDRKVLAKMASDFEKPGKIHTLYVREIQEKMWPLPIGDLFMCGKSSAKRMQEFEIFTIGDLAKTNPQLIERLFHKHGKMLWNFANGIDASDIVMEHAKAKGVGNSTTVPEDITKRQDAYRVLGELAGRVAGRLEKSAVLTGAVCVEIKYASFQSVSHQTILATPTAECDRIKEVSCELFDELWNGEPIRLLGIRGTKLSDVGEPFQMDLFSYQEQKVRSDKEKKAQNAMEQIQKKFGQNAISRGIRDDKDTGC